MILNPRLRKKVQDSLIEEMQEAKNGIDVIICLANNINDFLSKSLCYLRENREIT